MRKIIPTVFAKNKLEFNQRFEKLIQLNADLHIDIMDGKFIKSRGANIKDIPNIKKYKINFEAHLMTINPEKYISILKKKGFDKIIFHYEAVKDNNKVNNLIKKIKQENMHPILAFNPATNIINFNIDVLLMGVNPGKEHQKFISKVYKKIKRLRSINKTIKIHVDGGVNLSNIKKLRKLGVNYINSGSFIADAKNPKKALKKLERAFN